MAENQGFSLLVKVIVHAYSSGPDCLAHLQVGEFLYFSAALQSNILLLFSFLRRLVQIRYLLLYTIRMLVHFTRRTVKKQVLHITIIAELGKNFRLKQLFLYDISQTCTVVFTIFRGNYLHWEMIWHSRERHLIHLYLSFYMIRMVFRFSLQDTCL